MPLVKRSIEPINVSRAVISPGIRNELECVANNTLANIVQQLSSLSKHAENLFGELHRDTSTVMYRSFKLNDRIERLKQKIQQLNPTVEEVSLQDINMRKPFKSSVTKEQQILSLTSRPESISEKYAQCDSPPPLDKLDAYREDGKESMKFYTDPAFFFELWCQEMAKDADNQQKRHKHRNKRPRPVTEHRTIRAPKTHLDELKEKRHGPEFVGIPLLGREQAAFATDPRAGYQRPTSLEISSTPQSNQQPIVGQGFQSSDYGLVMGALANGTSARSGNVIDTNRGLQNQNASPKSGYGYQDTRRDETTPTSNYRGNEHGSRSMSLHQLTHENSLRQSSMEDPNLRPSMNQQVGGRYPNENRGGPGQGHRDVLSPRPNKPPPAPPEVLEHNKVDQHRLTRDGLPPPPPTTTAAQVIRSDSSASKLRSHYSPATLHDYPMQYSPKGRFDSSFDLPPPPTPPSELLSIPPTIPPPPMDDLQDSVSYQISPPPPPLPPPLNMNITERHIRKEKKHDWDNNNDVAQFTTDNISLTSDTSTTTASSKAEEQQQQARGDKPAIRDTRSDLLAAIHTGLNLRKVEERRLKTELKQKTSVRLDVQAMMEAAFEMRRKALEENDSDKDDDEEENWSDEG